MGKRLKNRRIKEEEKTCDRIRRVDEAILSKNHVAVTITIKSSGKINTLLRHALDKILGVGEVGIRMTIYNKATIQKIE